MIPAVRLPDGTMVPALGQGTWYMGEARASEADEAAALREGIERGLTLIDTAEMYGEGGAERVVARAIAGQRGRVFVVSKVYPHNASASGVAKACAASLKRLGTDRIDLYLLHWRGRYPLTETATAFERLREAGHIRFWGVSNFDTDDMAELAALPAGGICATDQVLYHPDARGIEFDLLPWCRARGMPIMAYSPLGQGGKLLRSPALAAVARRHDATPAQIAIAWSLRDGATVSIPKAASPEHVRQNAAAASIRLSAEDLAEIDAVHKPPRRKQPFAMI
ncbi:aldo/keto reductase [Acidiphilium sp. AL]|uniref:Aldo/keto reductase n=1 Tax=Acidiphilium iwatense TaxID=768198 RepID=A0ABS9DSA4_9PROT|nr:MULTISPECIES: aldo/keto reductase [Acidiphilium]MCF3945628.1 aldo/keto reductase [Acidiphilium iwatense]MCU4159568.1 aldo/keto reductase [Acidiphilium sp. AL]